LLYTRPATARRAFGRHACAQVRGGTAMSGLTVRFWGTRGSIPTPGRHTEKYGGNTTCVEVRHGGTAVVLDAGSGIRQMGAAWVQESRGEPLHAHLLFTHLHWDHIQGFPFFSPAYRKGNTFTV